MGAAFTRRAPDAWGEKRVPAARRAGHGGLGGEAHGSCDESQGLEAVYRKKKLRTVFIRSRMRKGSLKAPAIRPICASASVSPRRRSVAS